MKTAPKFVTIGVYGADEAAFFGTLRRTRVDTFFDIRGRRGLRGAEYAFANSKRLQKRLAELGIRYLHAPDVAPSASLREAQAKADKAANVARRKRAVLSDAFIKGYQRECLKYFDSRKFIERLGPEAKVVALFCVEREPAACHRSLLAKRLQKDLGVKVRDLIPGSES